jgi:hypothetical protein
MVRYVALAIFYKATVRTEGLAGSSLIRVGEKKGKRLKPLEAGWTALHRAKATVLTRGDDAGAALYVFGAVIAGGLCCT